MTSQTGHFQSFFFLPSALNLKKNYCKSTKKSGLTQFVGDKLELYKGKRSKTFIIHF